MNDRDGERRGTACPDSERLQTMVLGADRPPPEHVLGCESCRLRWRQARNLLGLLELEATELFPAACPDAAAWSAAAGSSLSRDLEIHLDRCEECRELWRYLTSVGPPSSRRVTARWRLRRWAAAASLLVGLLLWARPWSPIRSASETIIRGPAVVLEGSSRRLPGGDALLRWTPRADAESYRLRLWEENGRLVRQQALGRNSYRLELPIPSGADEILLWQVEVLVAGQPIGGTPVQRLRIGDVESDP